MHTTYSMREEYRFMNHEQNKQGERSMIKQIKIVNIVEVERRVSPGDYLEYTDHIIW